MSYRSVTVMPITKSLKISHEMRPSTFSRNRPPSGGAMKVVADVLNLRSPMSNASKVVTTVISADEARHGHRE